MLKSVFAIAFILSFTGCTIIDTRSELVVPVTAVLDPTSRLYQHDQIVVIGYLRCFGKLTRLYSTFDEANRASLINSITVVKQEDDLSCPGKDEMELAYCSYRGKMSLPDRYSAPTLIVDKFLQCTDLGPDDS
jgi:hypothetical protein